MSWRPIRSGLYACMGSRCPRSAKEPPQHCISVASGAARRRVLARQCHQLLRGKLSRDGLVIGLDNSVPMMEQAVGNYSHSRAVSMRAEALSDQFDDGALVGIGGSGQT